MSWNNLTLRAGVGNNLTHTNWTMDDSTEWDYDVQRSPYRENYFVVGDGTPTSKINVTLKTRSKAEWGNIYNWLETNKNALTSVRINTNAARLVEKLHGGIVYEESPLGNNRYLYSAKIPLDPRSTYWTDLGGTALSHLNGLTLTGVAGSISTCGVIRSQTQVVNKRRELVEGKSITRGDGMNEASEVNLSIQIINSNTTNVWKTAQTIRQIAEGMTSFSRDGLTTSVLFTRRVRQRLVNCAIYIDIDLVATSLNASSTARNVLFEDGTPMFFEDSTQIHYEG
jgi:hypothetical protein